MKCIDYYPPVLKEIYEIQEICKAVDAELEALRNSRAEVWKEFYIETAEDRGLEIWESIFNIVVSDSSNLELRRFNIISKLMGRNPNLIESLNALIGEENYSAEMVPDEYRLSVILKLGQKEYIKAVEEMLEAMVPVNILLDIRLLYNTHETLHKYTHQELKAYTHEMLYSKEL